ncbi:MAG: gas vesicle protein [Cytophagales bacterium]|nr:MAG: gas vesicle protein [Cytophagales bacterium]
MQSIQPSVQIKQETSLAEILDRVLAHGVVIQGELVISVAEVDLIYLCVNILITSANPHQPKNE